MEGGQKMSRNTHVLYPLPANAQIMHARYADADRKQETKEDEQDGQDEDTENPGSVGRDALCGSGPRHGPIRTRSESDSLGRGVGYERTRQTDLYRPENRHTR